LSIVNSYLLVGGLVRSILFVLIACVAMGCASSGEGGNRAAGGSGPSCIIVE